MASYLVTGATGAVGSALVPVLLEQPDAQLELLIRASSRAELDTRLQTLLEFCRIPRGDVARRARVRALRGDAHQPRLGLDEATYAELSARCTHLIHAAGTVRMNLPLEEARRAAVGSARAVLALARRCDHLAKLELVSTVGIAGRRRGVLPERWVSEPRAFHNTYEQAKAEAEEVVRGEASRGLPVTVHRPSMVVGDSRNGRVIHFQVFYFLCELLSGRRTLGLHPELGDARIDLIPADVVARAIAASCGEPSLAGHVLHVCSGPTRALRLEDLRGRVREAFAAHDLGVPRAVRVPRAWASRLARLGGRLVPGAPGRALSTLPVFLDYLADGQAFDNAAFDAWARRAGVSTPSPESYLPAVLGYYLGRRHGGPSRVSAALDAGAGEPAARQADSHA